MLSPFRSIRRGWNVPLPTLGGKQLWGDVWHGGVSGGGSWRIQEHVGDGRHRLLDTRGVRRAWGSFDHCRTEVDRLRPHDGEAAPKTGRTALVLHGLIRTRFSMRRMSRYLARECGYTVHSVSYPSTRAGVEWHAARLARVLDSLAGEWDEIDVVAHSMGNAVVRRYLFDEATASASKRPRIRRFVMLAPPNQGAQIARRFLRWPPVSTLFGQAGQEFGAGWNEIAPRLATPPCEFGIIAGGRGRQRGYNPLLTGDDDGVVRVEETRLAGASDFLVLPVLHTFIMDDRRSLEATGRFLQHGCFRSAEERQAIP
jgi:pimeloyl-ACP methyl ester carboxylesterase